jgi:hypothetical protein
MPFSDYRSLPTSTQWLYHGTAVPLKKGDVLHPHEALLNYDWTPLGGKAKGTYVFASGIWDWAATFGLGKFGWLTVFPVTIDEPDHAVIAVLEKEKASFETIKDTKTYVATVSAHSFNSGFPRASVNTPSNDRELVVECISEKPVSVENVEILTPDDLVRSGVQIMFAPSCFFKQGGMNFDLLSAGVKEGIVSWPNRDRPEYAKVSVPRCVCEKLGFTDLPKRTDFLGRPRKGVLPKNIH